MKINGKQMEIRNHTNLLKIEICKTIDKINEKYDFKIDYNVINLALSTIIKNNLERELEILYCGEE